MAAQKEVMPWEPLRSGRRGACGDSPVASSPWGGAWEVLPSDQLGPLCLEHPC